MTKPILSHINLNTYYHDISTGNTDHNAHFPTASSIMHEGHSRREIITIKREGITKLNVQHSF
jgi:hypothetical protein